MLKLKYKRSAQIEKVEENADGTLNVYGVATTQERDSDGEMILASAVHEATAGYMKWGALREMHQPKAAGTALSAEVDLETGITRFAAHVVDPVAITKVKTGVYKGFSIAGRVLERDKTDPTVVTKMTWVETSLVDRPANPGAMIDELLIVKADGLTLIEKSMWSVARLAELVASLQNIMADAAYTDPDASWPAGVRDGIATLCTAIQAAVAEAAPADVVAAMAKLESLGTECDALKAEIAALKVAHVDAVSKLGTVSTLEGEKTDLVGKLSGLTDQVAKLTGERNDALAKVEAVTQQATEREAAFAKSLTDATNDLFAKGHLRAVPKESDTGVQQSDDQTPKDETPRDQIRKIHQAGGNVTLAGVR